MRVTADSRNPDFKGYDWRILLNDHELECCVFADDVANVVEYHLKDPDGLWAMLPDGHPLLLRTVGGSVVIENTGSPVRRSLSKWVILAKALASAL